MNFIYSTAGGLVTIADAVSNRTSLPPVVYVPQHVDCDAYTAQLANFIHNCQGGHNGDDCEHLIRAVHVPSGSSFPPADPKTEAVAIEHVLSGLDSEDVPDLIQLLEVPHCKCCPQDAPTNTACSDVHAACHAAIYERIKKCSSFPTTRLGF
jgi:hypothetical protein